MVIKELDLFNKLRVFEPILTGTIPIGIDLPESDLDIICSFADPIEFQNKLEALFSKQTSFTCYLTKNGEVIARFNYLDFVFEIYGSSLPSYAQNAYLHMLKENEILKAYGEEFRKCILALKASGLKTEPAFARALDLKGDPYKVLLEYKVDPHFKL